MVARILPARDLASQSLSLTRDLAVLFTQTRSNSGSWSAAVSCRPKLLPHARHALVSQLKRSSRDCVAHAKHRVRTAQIAPFCLALAFVTVTLAG